MPQTISEKILSAHSGVDARAGDVVVCDVDLVLGTDASTPMAIDYFRRMNGDGVFDPSKIMFALDHYSGGPTAKTASFHAAVREFAEPRGIEVRGVGDGISFQIACEVGRALPGALIIGADSHTVTCGALNAFATGVGSSDLAAAMITGRLWLRVPESIEVTIVGDRSFGLTAKDIGLAMIAALGPEGANYRALEFTGGGLAELSIDDRLVIANLAVEAGAKAALFPCDFRTEAYLRPRTPASLAPVRADRDAAYVDSLHIDLARLTPRVARPHSPNDVVEIAPVFGTRVDMVFLGTCTGGRVADFHEALAVIERAGGRIAPAVQLVVTPASREVHDRLAADGTLARFTALGAVVTETGCGACCGTAGVIPRDGSTVLSTANRNFKARMGNATASIYLASPATCAASAVTGYITDPRTL